MRLVQLASRDVH